MKKTEIRLTDNRGDCRVGAVFLSARFTNLF